MHRYPGDSHAEIRVEHRFKAHSKAKIRYAVARNILLKPFSSISPPNLINLQTLEQCYCFYGILRIAGFLFALTFFLIAFFLSNGNQSNVKGIM